MPGTLALRRNRPAAAGDASCGNASQVERTLTIGLGDVERIDSLKVFWPDGAERAVGVIAVDRPRVIEQIWIVGLWLFARHPGHLYGDSLVRLLPKIGVAF